MAPDGKFNKKPYQLIANERGRDICDVWHAPVVPRHKKILIDIGELRADIKVGGYIFI